MLIRNEMTVLYPKLWTISEDAIKSLFEEAREALPSIAETAFERAA